MSTLVECACNFRSRRKRGDMCSGSCHGRTSTDFGEQSSHFALFMKDFQSKTAFCHSPNRATEHPFLDVLPFLYVTPFMNDDEQTFDEQTLRFNIRLRMLHFYEELKVQIQICVAFFSAQTKNSSPSQFSGTCDKTWDIELHAWAKTERPRYADIHLKACMHEVWIWDT